MDSKAINGIKRNKDYIYILCLILLSSILLCSGCIDAEQTAVTNVTKLDIRVDSSNEYGLGVGDLIYYTVSVSNTGNVDHPPVTLTVYVDGIKQNTYNVSSIAVGSSWSCTSTYTLTKNDVISEGNGDGSISIRATTGQYENTFKLPMKYTFNKFNPSTSDWYLVDDSDELIYYTDNSGASDHTYQEVITFIKNNPPNQQSDSGYLHDIAEFNGIRCGLCIMRFEGDDELYPVAVFNTLDRGEIYVAGEYVDGEGVVIGTINHQIGDSLHLTDIYTNEEFDYDLTIEDVNIFW